MLNLINQKKKKKKTVSELFKTIYFIWFWSQCMASVKRIMDFNMK